MLWFRSAAVQRARDCAVAHCSLRIHMKSRDASCCEQNAYDILISLNRVFVFEFRNRFHLVPHLEILRKSLSSFGILEKQDSS